MTNRIHRDIGTPVGGVAEQTYLGFGFVFWIATLEATGQNFKGIKFPKCKDNWEISPDEFVAVLERVFEKITMFEYVEKSRCDAMVWLLQFFSDYGNWV